MTFTCPRCHYETTHITSYRNHLSKKKTCQSHFANDDPNEILDKLNDSKRMCHNYECEYCHKTFSSSQGKYQHKLRCNHSVAEEENEVSQLRNEILEMKNLMAKIQEHKSSEDVNKLKQDLLFYKNKKNEVFYQGILEQFLKGTHKKLLSGVTDVTTDTCHAEIKEWCCYKEGIGQLMAYNVCDPKEKLEMYMFGNYSNGCKDAAASIISACNIQLYEFSHKDDRVDIINYENKSILYSYIPTF
jgi:hypothetical protein